MPLHHRVLRRGSQNDPSLLDTWLADKTPERVREWIEAATTYAIVAEIDAEIVGVAMMQTSGEITLLYILPEVRFGGVGKALLAALESRARESGLRELRLSGTKTAHAFYLRNGFESVGSPSACSGVECRPMAKSLVSQQ